ncbi:MAG TPA: CPBP family intramembrane glutamic endopeptidase [Thermoanaerobaculia bacterium]
MSGVVAITVLVLPPLLERLPAILGRKAPPVPMTLLLLLSMAQSAILLALAVWAGTALAPAVGLHAPAFEAIVTRHSIARALKPQLMAGLIGGAFGGILIVAFSSLAPSELKAVQKTFDVPLIARVLYGGLTEELLLRWGVMTLLLWIAWRFFQRRAGSPKSLWVWLAIIMSALAFGAGHLPAAAMLIGTLRSGVVVSVVAVNAVFGILAGYLFWRYGLEAAMIAHAFAHTLNYVIAMF